MRLSMKISSTNKKREIIALFYKRKAWCKNVVKYTLHHASYQALFFISDLAFYE